MSRTFVEIVLTANQEYVKGFLQGYIAGVGIERQFFFNHDAGIEAESLTEKIQEWTSFSDKFQYLILEKELYEALQASAAFFDDATRTVSVKNVKSCHFEVTIKAHSRDDSQAIRELVQLRPSTLEMIDWQESEEIDEKAKGVELYTPAHDYTYKASGSFKGDLETVVDFRKKLTGFSAVTAQEIKLERE